MPSGSGRSCHTSPDAEKPELLDSNSPQLTWTSTTRPSPCKTLLCSPWAWRKPSFGRQPQLTTSPLTISRCQDDLAEMLVRPHVRQRLVGLIQREGSVDRQSELTALDMAPQI